MESALPTYLPSRPLLRLQTLSLFPLLPLPTVPVPTVPTVSTHFPSTISPPSAVVDTEDVVTRSKSDSGPPTVDVRRAQVPPGAHSPSGSSSSSGEDDDVLSNAIFSAIPKKSVNPVQVGVSTFHEMSNFSLTNYIYSWFWQFLHREIMFSKVT